MCREFASKLPTYPSAPQIVKMLILLFSFFPSHSACRYYTANPSHKHPMRSLYPSKLPSYPSAALQIVQMASMLSSCDGGVSKNACFALSCLAASELGHRRLLTTPRCDAILKSLATLVGEIDDESSWFAAM